MPKNSDLRIRVNVQQRALLEQMAAISGQNLSNYCRSRLFEEFGLHIKLNKVLEILENFENQAPKSPRGSRGCK